MQSRAKKPGNVIGTIALLVSGMTIMSVLSFGQTPAQWVSSHNNYRRTLIGYDGKTTSSPDLTWSDGLAKDAQEWANQVAAAANLKHRPNSSRSTSPDARAWGENLAWGSSDSYDGIAAITAWYNEKPFFQPPTSTCTPNNVCGHFTQVISQLSREVGCATASGADMSVYVVCNYSPHGNTQENGAYAELYNNQRPPVPGGALFGNLKGIGLDLKFDECLRMTAVGLLAAPPANAGAPTDLAAACTYSKVRAYDSGIGAAGFTGTADNAGAALINLYFKDQVMGLNGGVVVSLNPLRVVLVTGE